MAAPPPMASASTNADMQSGEEAELADPVGFQGFKVPQAGVERGGRSFWHLARTGSNTSELVRLADKARSAFKRPTWWVLVFGWSLAVCAGIVNAVSFQAFDLFVSHGTGATTSIGLGIEGVSSGRHGWEQPAKALELVLSFFIGAFACGLLIDKTQVHFGGKALYGAALVGNSALLVLSVVIFELMGDELLSGCLAAAACGLQNAMCTSHFGAVIRTTHVTGTITDMGSTMGRMSMIFLRKRCQQSRLNVLESAEIGVDARKLLVLGPMWASFLSGTIIGAFLFKHLQVYAMLVPATLTLLFGMTYACFRNTMKSKLKRIEQKRLKHQIGDLSVSLNRTRSLLDDVHRTSRKAGRRSSMELQIEFGQMLEAMHKVEDEIEQMYGESGEDDDSESTDEDDEAESQPTGESRAQPVRPSVSEARRC